LRGDRPVICKESRTACPARPVPVYLQLGRDGQHWGAAPGVRLSPELSSRFAVPQRDYRARCMRGDQPDGRSPEGTRRSSHARCLSLTFAAPGTKPRRYVLVGDPATLVEFLDAGLDLIQLPALRLDKGRDRL